MKPPYASRFTRYASRVLCSLLLLAGCDKNPFERTHDASGGGGTGRFGSGNFVIFSGELQSGGGSFFYPGGENQVISFADTSNPISRRSIRYTWNGQDTSSPCGGTQHIFVGFDLMHTATQATYAGTLGRDLTKAGYTRATFYARGSLSSRTVVKIEMVKSGTDPCASLVTTPPPCIVLSATGSDDTDGAPCGNKRVLTGNWQLYSLDITPDNLAAVKDFFKATFVFNPLIVGSTAPGQGGTVYFDQIQYEP